MNPHTGKYILVNGRTHRNLLKNGTEFHTNSIQCPEGKAYNTKTKRFVKIGSRTYNDAKKMDGSLKTSLNTKILLLS